MIFQYIESLNPQNLDFSSYNLKKMVRKKLICEGKNIIFLIPHYCNILAEISCGQDVKSFFVFLNLQNKPSSSSGQRMFPQSLDLRTCRMLTLLWGFSSGGFENYWSCLEKGSDYFGSEIIWMFRPKPDALPEIYTTLGQDYDDRVINISVW